MSKEELININGIREDLYQAMQIGDITLNSKHSQELYDFMNYQDKEIKRLKEEIEQSNNIINELEKDMIERYHKAIDYQSKIMQSDLMQGDYPVSYYYAEQNEKLLNYYLNKLQELKGSNSNENL